MNAAELIRDLERAGLPQHLIAMEVGLAQSTVSRLASGMYRRTRAIGPLKDLHRQVVPGRLDFEPPPWPWPTADEQAPVFPLSTRIKPLREVRFDTPEDPHRAAIDQQTLDLYRDRAAAELADRATTLADRWKRCRRWIASLFR